MTTTTQSVCVTRKTRAGAASFFKNLGYAVDEWFEDDYWNGQKRVPVRVRFTIVERGPKDFAVVREVEKNVEA